MSGLPATADFTHLPLDAGIDVVSNERTADYS